MNELIAKLYSEIGRVNKPLEKFSILCKLGSVFILIITYEWSQQARVFVPLKPF